MSSGSLGGIRFAIVMLSSIDTRIHDDCSQVAAPAHERIKDFARRHPSIVFVVHQALIFIAGISFLSTVRKLTGKSIHLGRALLG